MKSESELHYFILYLKEGGRISLVTILILESCEVIGHVIVRPDHQVTPLLQTLPGLVPGPGAPVLLGQHLLSSLVPLSPPPWVSLCLIFCTKQLTRLITVISLVIHLNITIIEIMINCVSRILNINCLGYSASYLIS